MPDCFEILHKDLGGRIGKLETPHGTVETPLLMPVVNPHLPMIKTYELAAMGAEMLITNSYIISQDDLLKDRAIKEGIHRLIGFDGPIMTDSGAFQLSVYGKVEVQPLEILRLQEEIGSDIVVPLDIPTPPDVSRDRAESELAETEKRLLQASLERSDRCLLAGPIQGSTFTDLREESARRLCELKFDVYPIGAVVPLMESYRYKDLVNVVMSAKAGLGPGFPVHLFGAGHPMVFALAAAMGCDMFDSAAYALYARQGRYMTHSGTWKLDELKYLPCSCPVCRSTQAEELRQSEDKLKLLAGHNLYVSFQEMQLVRQCIWEGSLWDLLEARCRSHPRMLQGLIALSGHRKRLERLDRSSKSTFFYLGPQSSLRPEVERYASRIDRISLEGRILITDIQAETTGEFDHVIGFKPPFGPYPNELSETYPLNAEVPDDMDIEALKQAAANTRRLISANPNAQFVLRLRSTGIEEMI